MKLASRIAKIEGSKTLQVKEKALQLQADGIDVVDLTAGEPDFNTPDHIGRAGIRAIEEGFTRYTANTGIPALRKAIADKLERENRLHYTPEQIIVSNGAKQSILNALLAVAEKGDKVLLAAPYWVSYPEQVKLADAEPVIIDTTKSGFKITPQLLKQHLNPSVKAIILNSPCNPTGVVYTAAELQALADILQHENIWIISDEIYEKIIFDELPHTSIASYHNLAEKTIVINGMSKAYAMTGWRIGYAAGPLAVVKAMSKVQSHYTSNASSISQKAALEAVNGPDDVVTGMCKVFEKRRDFIREKLDAQPVLSYVNPQGAFYFFINASGLFGCDCEGIRIEDSLSLSAYLTEKHHLVTVPGIAFGADEYIRISFATSMEQLEKGMGRLLKAVDKIQSEKKG
ncbi:MAG: pyridoxal phosphate-dependent aminotransferase [Calditrichia bacterium]